MYDPRQQQYNKKEFDAMKVRADKLEAENTDIRTRIQDGADLISGYQKDLDNARAENKRYRESLEKIRRYKCEICNGDDDLIRCCPNACPPYIAIKALKESKK